MMTSKSKGNFKDKILKVINIIRKIINTVINIIWKIITTIERWFKENVRFFTWDIVTITMICENIIEKTKMVAAEITKCDAPEHLNIWFQDPATPIMEGILLFNQHLLIIMIIILLTIGWLLFWTILNFKNYTESNYSFFHSNLLEIVWTSIPALILLTLATPSFTLLYSMDEIAEPKLSLKVLGHQWFWSYEISDFNSCLKNKQSLKYTCYMLSHEELKTGFLRNLETNKRIVLPTNTHIRLLVSATDVLHSWTIPSFGLKVDACPGRLNQLNLFVKRIGVFFGQCSEICGVNHGFMPIVVLTLPTTQFYYLTMNNLV